jgi:hypothetical protein
MRAHLGCRACTLSSPICTGWWRGRAALRLCNASCEWHRGVTHAKRTCRRRRNRGDRGRGNPDLHDRWKFTMLDRAKVALDGEGGAPRMPLRKGFRSLRLPPRFDKCGGHFPAVSRMPRWWLEPVRFDYTVSANRFAVVSLLAEVDTALGPPNPARGSTWSRDSRSQRWGIRGDAASLGHGQVEIGFSGGLGDPTTMTRDPGPRRALRCGTVDGGAVERFRDQELVATLRTRGFQ